MARFHEFTVILMGAPILGPSTWLMRTSLGFLDLGRKGPPLVVGGGTKTHLPADWGCQLGSSPCCSNDQVRSGDARRSRMREVPLGNQCRLSRVLGTAALSSPA